MKHNSDPVPLLAARALAETSLAQLVDALDTQFLISSEDAVIELLKLTDDYREAHSYLESVELAYSAPVSKARNP